MNVNYSYIFSGNCIFYIMSSNSSVVFINSFYGFIFSYNVFQNIQSSSSCGGVSFIYFL
jgi:hypothetical protein